MSAETELQDADQTKHHPLRRTAEVITEAGAGGITGWFMATIINALARVPPASQGLLLDTLIILGIIAFPIIATDREQPTSTPTPPTSL